jgi:hypothetical protein
MTGAQAADLPVKAKPVQYVKICSLYGAGFYYIPGTDTCIKIGGFVRLQTQYNVNGNSSNGPLFSNNANRTTNDYTTRNRGYITADARSQTEYGTLRGYIAVGNTGDNTGGSQTNGLTVNRLFMQLAGFTAGRAVSFYDFTSTAALAYMAGAAMNFGGGSTTGDGGWTVLGYTAQFGNGLSASIAVEDNRVGTINRYTGASTTATTGQANGNKMPDFVANLRVDQAWGSAQIMGALHDASGTYRDAAFATHPSNAMGYALGAGIKVNLPMLGKGDFIDVMTTYTKGASRYASSGSSYFKANGGFSGGGLNSDAVFGTATTGNMELTEVWSTFGGIQHNWNSMWKTSLYGSYATINYNGNASALICAGAANCNPDWSTYQIGSRTAWAPVKNLEVGVDVMYTYLNAANTGVTTTSADQSAWIAQLRIQRNFYP